MRLAPLFATLPALFFLSSCALSPSAPVSTHAPPPPATPGLAAAQTIAAQQAQQADAASTAAHAVVEAAVLRGIAATEARRMTEEARADRATDMALESQQEARYGTATAAAMQSTGTAQARAPGATIEAARTKDAATAVREAERMLATETAKREQNVTAIQTGMAILPSLWGLLWIGIIGGASSLALYWLFGRARANIRRQSIHETGRGVVIIATSPDGQITAAPVFPQLDTAHEPPRRLPTEPSRINPRVLAEYRTPEGKNRRGEVIDLLRAAREAEEAGKHNGRRIPRYDTMPEYESRTEAWMKATRILEAAGLVYKVASQGPQKSGTFLCGNWTVKALLSRVEDGSVSLQPVNVAENETKRAEETIER